VNGLKLEQEAKDRLLALKPGNYIGLAQKIAGLVK